MPRFPSFSALIVLTALLVLGACASRYSAPVADIDPNNPRYVNSGRTHRVNGGETLYVVAWMYDLDVNALARVNNLREPYNIEPGQRLLVDLRGVPGAAGSGTAVATTPAAPVGSATVTAAAVPTGISRTPLDSAPIARQSLPSTPLPDSNAPAAIPPPASTPAPTAPRTEPAPVTPTPDVARTDTAPAPLPQRELPPPTSTVPPPAATTTTPPSVATAPAPAVVIPPAPTPAPAAEPEGPVTTNVANDAIVWAWPARGNIIGRYSDSNPDNKGIKLSGKAGDPVLAAADGEVVYTGNGLLRYGELVILKHNDHFLSAYAHNKVINVKEGDRVRRGTKIAELGSTGIDRDMLHFEIRLDGQPVDPMTYLPAR
jgi:lipoprotein NlpD